MAPSTRLMASQNVNTRGRHKESKKCLDYAFNGTAASWSFMKIRFISARKKGTENEAPGGKIIVLIFLYSDFFSSEILFYII